MDDHWIGPGALARATSVSTDTLRHYERLGLLANTARTSAGYRRYAPSAVDRVRLIQRALTVGFSLRELASALRQRDQGMPPCRRMRSLMSQRLDELDAKLVALTDLRNEMRVILRDWDARLAQTPAGQPARLLDMLAGRTALEDQTRVVGSTPNFSKSPDPRCRPGTRGL